MRGGNGAKKLARITKFCIMVDEQLSTGEHWEEIVPPISQDMGRKAVDEPKKRNPGPFCVFAKEEIPEAFYYIGGLWGLKRE